ncbi:MAG TPA: hypothetical protein VGP47_06850 [Parachlamydiaceae bacterium]|nr:hypothetical protein [Parachlamydiaceae bacterium]
MIPGVVVTTAFIFSNVLWAITGDTLDTSLNFLILNPGLITVGFLAKSK